MDAQAMRSLIGNIILCVMGIAVVAAFIRSNWDGIRETFTDENGKWDVMGGLERYFNGGGRQEEVEKEPQNASPDEDFLTQFMRQKGAEMADFDPDTFDPAKEWVREHIIFSGRVQGVGFRYQAMVAARTYGLTGWVENLPDGSVEMEVQGTPLGIGRMMTYLKGGHWIRIDDMDLESLQVVPGEKGFNVKGY